MVKLLNLQKNIRFLLKLLLDNYELTNNELCDILKIEMKDKNKFIIIKCNLKIFIWYKNDCEYDKLILVYKWDTTKFDNKLQ